MRFPRSLAMLVAVVLAVAAMLALSRSAAAQVDVAPPVIVSLTISPTLVNTSQTSQTVTITAHITDDLSGLDGATIWFGSLLYGSDQDKSVFFWSYNLIAGDTVDGTYVAELELPRYSGDGRWIAKYMVMRDEVGNQADCNTNGEQECPAGWSTFYFVNVRDSLFFYLPQLMGRRFLVPG